MYNLNKFESYFFMAVKLVPLIIAACKQFKNVCDIISYTCSLSKSMVVALIVVLCCCWCFFFFPDEVKAAYTMIKIVMKLCELCDYMMGTTTTER